MTDPITPEPNGLQIALAYYRAWTTQDFDRAMTFIAPAIVCDAPAGRLEGAPAFRAFMEPFSRIVRHSDLLAAFGDEKSAVLIYRTETAPVRDAPGAEHLVIADGLIAHLRIVFDRLPFVEVRQRG